MVVTRLHYNEIIESANEGREGTEESHIEDVDNDFTNRFGDYHGVDIFIFTSHQYILQSSIRSSNTGRTPTHYSTVSNISGEKAERNYDRLGD